MIYTDGTHLVGDSLGELHEFARRIGLKPEWFQDHPRHPHYDLLGYKVNRALREGAMPVTSRMIVKLALKSCKKERDEIALSVALLRFFREKMEAIACGQ